MSDVEQRRKVRIVAVAQQQAIARNQADEMRERFFDGVQIFKNVRVIEFEVVDDGDFRQVMDELAALVEKRRVIFVALDDEPFAVREPRALAEVVRNAADEIARIQPVMLEHPREQRRGRGFAMRAGDDDGTFAANEKFLEQLRQRAITQFVIEHKLRFRVAAGNRVADDDQVRVYARVSFRITVHHLDLFAGEERGHGRIDILVRAGDRKAFVFHGRRRRGHRGAADAGKVNRFDFR